MSDLDDLELNYHLGATLNAAENLDGIGHLGTSMTSW